MLPRSADVASDLLLRIHQLEGENADLRSRLEALEQREPVLVDGLRPGRARLRALAQPLTLPRTRPA
jgi:hypothetical protein